MQKQKVDVVVQHVTSAIAFIGLVLFPVGINSRPQQSRHRNTAYILQRGVLNVYSLDINYYMGSRITSIQDLSSILSFRQR
jgi:hypothetical protein